MKRPFRPLRFRLFLLAASGLLPLAIVCLTVLAYATDERERDAQQAALEVSRALATAVDAELRATASVLQSLALSDELAPGRLREFHALARRVASSQGWRSVVLADASGNVLMSSALELGTVDSEAGDRASMERAIATRRSVVGPVTEWSQRQGPAFAVRLPVLQQEKVGYVLSAVIPAEKVRSIILRQNVPESWIVAVFDQTGTTVARSRPNPTRRPSPSLQKMLDSGAPEGRGPTYTLEGRPVQSGFSRIRTSDWVVATGISADQSVHGLFGALGAVGGGLLASLAFSAFLAWYFARGVSDPIDALKSAAAALGRGEPVRVPHLEIAELGEVGAALELASNERDRAAQERQAGEAEREQLLARVTEALRQTEEAGRSKDEFLAMLGHELRNPLAPMGTALHLMARKGDERTRAEREVMERQVAHMKRLVDDLLDVSRITSKRLTMRFEPLRLADVVRHAALAVQPVLGTRRFTLDIAPGGEELWVSGDEVRLGQVLNNLLANAIKFTGPQAAISLRLRRQDDQAEMLVTDTGVGMSPEVLQKVFELFYQAPQGADRSLGGLGLGLAIVRSLVEMHGGSVRAASEGVGHGCTMCVELPLIAAPRQAQAGPPAAAPAAQNGCVLVVDDNRDAADTAAALLDLAGFEVKVAYDPEVALALLEEFRPGVALLDIGLPDMSGYELAGRVQAHRNGRDTWLVALTGYGTQADIQRARAAGFHRHLVKPAPPDALLAAVEEGLKEDTP